MKKNSLFEECLSNVAPGVRVEVHLMLDSDFVDELLSYGAEEKYVNKIQEFKEE